MINMNIYVVISYWKKKKKLTSDFFLMIRYKEGEVHFNLMAVVSDRKLILEQRLLSLQTQELVNNLYNKKSIY